MYKMEIRSVIVTTSALVLLLSVFQSTAALTRSSGDKELRTASVNIDDGGQDAFSVASNKDVSFSLTFPSTFPGIFSPQSVVYSLATSLFIGAIGYVIVAMTSTTALLIGNGLDFIAGLLLGLL